ncbi:hypothetical protein SMITH_596 [Smithella sp. ME-1]|uniref:Uncharacterized protein n=1 Tax=hydrocarbon metagenome TaxID=938273 RepID=A0A0W8FKS0_9ZZZZ|nr:hypothetical protein SMITH_596 [Smithella sp. ME-1]
MLFYVFILFRSFGLTGNSIELRFYFLNDIVQPQYVLFCRLHFTDRGFLTTFVFGYTGGILYEQSSIFRFGFNQILHMSLFNQRICSGANTCAHKKFFNIKKAAGNLIEIVFMFPLTNNFTGNRYFTQLGISPRKTLTVGNQSHGNFRYTYRRGILTAVENNVIHLCPAQRFDSLFTHYPANCVNDIGFSATVGPDNPCNSVVKIKDNFIAK